MVIRDCKIIDDGQMGVIIQTPNNGSAPRVCPGLGGWKADPDAPGCYFTRLKGDAASKVLIRIDPGFPYADLDLNPDGAINRVIPV